MNIRYLIDNFSGQIKKSPLIGAFLNTYDVDFKLFFGILYPYGISKDVDIYCWHDFLSNVAKTKTVVQMWAQLPTPEA